MKEIKPNESTQSAKKEDIKKSKAKNQNANATAQPLTPQNVIKHVSEAIDTALDSAKSIVSQKIALKRANKSVEATKTVASSASESNQVQQNKVLFNHFQDTRESHTLPYSIILTHQTQPSKHPQHPADSINNQISISTGPSAPIQSDDANFPELIQSNVSTSTQFKSEGVVFNGVRDHQVLNNQSNLNGKMYVAQKNNP